LICKHFDDERPKPLDDDVKVLLFRVVSELLVNVVKHAQAHEVNVSVQREDDHILIVVEDDGVGFDVAQMDMHWREGGGFGLFSIRERLQPLGGQLEITSAPGQGTRVVIMAPLKIDESSNKEKTT
jgi:signal transduction histidine kinase